MSPAVSLAGAYYRNNTEVAGVDGSRGLFILAGYYALSKRTSLYAEIDRTRYRGGLIASSAQSRQTGISLGINHLF
nr:hypothetical protein [Noviherbaspirillum aerium]